MDLGQLAAQVRGMMGDDPAHDFAHVMRVYGNAKELCKKEDADQTLALCAALLHDVVSYPKLDPHSKNSAAESAQKAVPILQKHGLEQDEIDTIAEAIRDHSFSRGVTPRTITGKILQDADRLDALGAIGIARTFATGGLLRRPLYDPDDPFCKDRDPDDSAWTVDHFFTKLLAVESGMNTQAGRAEAKRRTVFLKEFLGRLEEEL
ncbi:MAG: HD domain-containing protein [Nitrosopumilus sp. H13]|nr:MAG: HD domain-containing protein [Nitrosopumilus sp. H13]